MESPLKNYYIDMLVRSQGCYLEKDGDMWFCKADHFKGQNLEECDDYGIGRTEGEALKDYLRKLADCDLLNNR